MMGKRCEGQRESRSTVAVLGAPKPACAAACDPARLPSARREFMSYTPFMRPVAKTP